MISGVARVTLRRPAVRNCLDDETIATILAALDRAEATPGCRAFVVDADAPEFCTGMPLDGSPSHWLSTDVSPPRTLFTRLAHSELVTIAVVDGAAIGGGVGLAAACDRVLAGPSATFRLTEVALGLIPAIVLPVLARRIGAREAFSLALTASEISGRHARRIGLVDVRGASPDVALRHELIRLRRADAAALRALKRYRVAIDPVRFSPTGFAEHALRERLDDPEVRRRLDALRGEGLLHA